MLDTLASAPDAVFQALDGFLSWDPPRQVFHLVSFITFLAAVMLSRLLSAPPMIAIPLAYITLFNSAMISNFLARDIFLSGASDVMKVTLFTIIAHALVSPVLLYMLKSSEHSTR